MATKKMNYDSIAFKNRDIDKFATAFSEKKDPIKMPSITSERESTNVNTSGSKAFTPKSKEYVNLKKSKGQLIADEVYKKRQTQIAQQKKNK